LATREELLIVALCLKSRREEQLSRSSVGATYRPVVMAAVEIRPFADEHLEGAAALLAERHRRHRLAEPLLPARFEEPSAARGELDAVWEAAGASGAVALERGRVTGFLVGAPRDPSWGSNVWVEFAGHAVEEHELARDLYGAAAERWVEEGNTRHYVLAPADPALIDAWFHVGFGLQHIHAIRELPDELPAERAGIQVGPAEERDVDDLIEIAPLIQDLQARSPVFGYMPPDDPDELRAEILDDIATSQTGCLVAEVADRVVGNFVIVPVERTRSLVGLGRPDGAAHLGFAATRPDVRGTGAGLALTDASFRWAREQGYAAMVTDWRATNLLSSRFWPRRGFRPTFYRLYRSIP
jgi:GNAT superfamily N-acetyltransferase